MGSQFGKFIGTPGSVSRHTDSELLV